MADFSYKTRGNTTPQGKPRVYFTSHPDDAALFDSIADEILSLANCAVYRQSGSITDKEEHLFNLSAMALIVIPVTKSLLTKPCDAIATELPYALEHHIPVLPLMQEGGLLPLYQKVFGDLQYLDKNARDDTAISYEDKFKNHIASIIFGSDLQNLVREAFDAYIFLSYRKKDRRLAKELMRLIHENEFCRDIAIWYDEFLTPGEDFNNTISEALEKSELFVMAVTPNLVNEKNYIMTTEYPMAKKSDKTILPVEMEKTGTLSLKMKYPKIPRTVNCQNPAELAKALTNALSHVACLKNDSDPEHNYLIGIAYLIGIDVERNPKRALELFTKAARAGHVKAIEQLIRMYSMGEGTARDHGMAITWQEALVKQYRQSYDEKPLETTCSSYVAHLQTLSTLYQANHRFDKAIEALNPILLFDRGKYVWIRMTQIEALLKMGSCYLTQSRFDDATVCYQRALVLCEEEPDLVTQRKKQLDAYQSLGRMAFGRLDCATARSYFEKARLIIEDTFYRINFDPVACFTFYLNYGMLLISSNEGKEGETLLLKANDYAETCMAENGPWALETTLGNLYLTLGGFHLNHNRINLAKHYVEKGITYLEGWYELFGLSDALLVLSQGYLTLSIVYNILQDFKTARKLQEKHLEACKTVAREQNTVISQQALAKAYYTLGGEDNTKEAVSILEKLLPITNGVDIKLSLSGCYVALGSLALQSKDFENANTYYTKASEILYTICRSHDDTEAKKLLGDSYQGIGTLHELRFQHDEAITYYRKALNWYLAVAEESTTHIAKNDVVVIYQKLYSLENLRAHYDEATEYLLLSLEYSDLLLQDTNIAPMRYTVAASYFNASTFLAMHGDKEKARYCAEKSILLWQDLAKEFPNEATYTTYLTMAKQYRLSLG